MIKIIPGKFYYHPSASSVIYTGVDIGGAFGVMTDNNTVIVHNKDNTLFFSNLVEKLNYNYGQKYRKDGSNFLWVKDRSFMVTSPTRGDYIRGLIVSSDCLKNPEDLGLSGTSVERLIGFFMTKPYFDKVKFTESPFRLKQWIELVHDYSVLDKEFSVTQNIISKENAVRWLSENQNFYYLESYFEDFYSLQMKILKINS